MNQKDNNKKTQLNRIVMKNKDLEILYGCSPATASKKMKEVKEKLKIDTKEVITIDNFLSVKKQFTKEQIISIMI